MVPDYNRQVQYYDGYDPRLHKTVWFDDYYGDLRWRSWLQANDDTPFRVNKKGAMSVFNPEWTVYTSNAHPHEWYSKMFQSDEKRRAFERRVTVMIEFIRPNNIRYHKGSADDLPDAVKHILNSKHVYNAHDAVMNRGLPPPRAIDPDYAWFCQINGAVPAE